MDYNRYTIPNNTRSFSRNSNVYLAKYCYNDHDGCSNARHFLINIVARHSNRSHYDLDDVSHCGTDYLDVNCHYNHDCDSKFRYIFSYCLAEYRYYSNDNLDDTRYSSTDYLVFTCDCNHYGCSIHHHIRINRLDYVTYCDINDYVNFIINYFGDLVGDC
ncbi:Uncharacterised protein [Streptococcus pneumoniae]|nr:Uncharacterised protein [Streptococcus pneumoniae]